MRKNMQCLILAGGFATRLYPLTLNKAKALLPYRGKAIIDHIIEKIPADMDILVSTNQLFEPDFARWQKGLNRKVEIGAEQAVTEQQKKGAITAIDYWIKNRRITGDLLVIAADNYFEFDLSDMIRQYDGYNALVAVHDFANIKKIQKIGQPCQYGLVTLENNRITGFYEKPEFAVSSIVATGIYLLPDRIFPILSEYCASARQDNLGSFISYLVPKNSVYAYRFQDFWTDVGNEMLKYRFIPEIAGFRPDPAKC